MVRETILTAPDKWTFTKQTLEPIFSDIVLAIIVLLIGLIIGRIVGKLVQTLLHSFELNKSIKKQWGLQIRMEQFFGTGSTYILYVISFVFALDVLQLTSIIVYLLGTIVILIIAASILLSIKDFLPNFMAGLLLQRRKRVRIGEVITFRNIKGKIIQRTLLETKVRTQQGDVFNIPNSLFMKELMITYPKEKETSH